MGLLKNLSLLFNDDLITRMLNLERRQELLEDYTDQKLDSMKSYSARVLKRERDAGAKEETLLPTMSMSRADQKRALRRGNGA
jgi:hypothetical protein